MSLHTAEKHECCHVPNASSPSASSGTDHANHAHAHHASSGIGDSLPRLTTSATLHCLTGCALGEFAGLAIGVTLGLNPWATMALATVLGFASGYALGLRPLIQRGMSVAAAFKAIWLGETISIAAMEFAMNFTDYHVGGVQAASMLSPVFWLGYLLALPAGFVVAWPVNYWLLRRNVKQPCH
ncbi:MAG TPA: DUF4396 domain-containing protein [Verrucomicrobiae bacterium]|nr:DUF4396 domain-containing protein [Verrucomicrobiae bacterium]